MNNTPTDINTIIIALSNQEQAILTCEQARNMGFTPEMPNTAQKCTELLKEKGCTLFVTGSDFDGLSFPELLQLCSATRFVFVSSKPRIEEAVEVMKRGGLDYLCQPFDAQHLQAILNRVLQAARNRREQSDSSINPALETDEFEDACHLPGSKTQVYGQGRYIIVSANPAMKRLLARLKSVASSKASVLIMGESGTGKELLARYIHAASDRANAPFVALNCAALPETLLESELFGHEKGAFSGAFSRRLGRFEQANGGTILLDEITEMSTPLQAKLLRVLQEGEVDRLGGSAPVKVNVRVIATTNRDILTTVKEGRFREDLYYRLNVIPVVLPSLKERPEDIETLARYFLKQFSSEYQKNGLSFASGVLEKLRMMDWPGNIRELRNAIERGALLAQGSDVTIEDIFGFENTANYLTLPKDTETAPVEMPVHDRDEQATEPMETGIKLPINEPEGGDSLNLAEMEKKAIRLALSRTEGNRTHAATILGISVRTLRNKLAEYRQMGIIL